MAAAVELFQAGGGYPPAAAVRFERGGLPPPAAAAVADRLRGVNPPLGNSPCQIVHIKIVVVCFDVGSGNVGAHGGGTNR